MSRKHSLVPVTYLRTPNTQDLFARYDQLWRKLAPYLRNPIAGDERINALEGPAYVSGLLNHRMFEAQYSHTHDGARIFLSHASSDKAFVKALAMDLSALGHQPWLDEWEMLGGESIPTIVAEGLKQADVAIIVLSKNSAASRWMENEWPAKYWQEVNERRVTLVPLLLSDCEIPTLLKTNKCIDFRCDYGIVIEEFGRSVSKHIKKRVRNGS